jgi:sugar lactone lactonase YvrE
MVGFDIRSPAFARYILSNAGLETLATGFRWIEGPVWMGDANCLLFQDLPNDRTMRAGAIIRWSPFPLTAHNVWRTVRLKVCHPSGHRTRRNGDEDQREGGRLWP